MTPDEMALMASRTQWMESEWEFGRLSTEYHAAAYLHMAQRQDVTEQLQLN